MKETFTSHLAQVALRETRRTEWNKWMKFNAGVVSTDEEVRRLTEVGCEIYPMKRIDTDKTRICEEIMITFLFLQSTRVDWFVAETSRRQKDFAQIPQLVMWIRTILFAVGVLRAHVSIHSCDFTKGNFQGQEIDPILLYLSYSS